MTLAAGVFAGCQSDPEPSLDERIAAAFPDAEKRFGNATAGDHVASYPFRLPDGTTRLTVKAGFRAPGEASFVLVDPQNNGLKFETFRDGRERDPSGWYDQFQPMEGGWKINVHLGDGGRYLFGVYWEP